MFCLRHPDRECINVSQLFSGWSIQVSHWAFRVQVSRCGSTRTRKGNFPARSTSRAAEPQDVINSARVLMLTFLGCLLHNSKRSAWWRTLGVFSCEKAQASHLRLVSEAKPSDLCHCAFCHSFGLWACQERFQRTGSLSTPRMQNGACETSNTTGTGPSLAMRSPMPGVEFPQSGAALLLRPRSLREHRKAIRRLMAQLSGRNRKRDFSSGKFRRHF